MRLFALVSVACAQHAQAVEATLVFVTDAHGWYSGHGRHNETFDADYGSLVSFVERLSAREQVFLLENGDLVDGGGLTDATSARHPRRGESLFAVLDDVGFAARTLGNHELYSPAAVRSLALDAAPASAAFVSSNAIHAATGEALARPFKRLALRGGGDDDDDGDAHLLVLGLLYEMTDAAPDFKVVSVASVIATQWFADEVHAAAGVVALAHMGATNPLLRKLLAAVRAMRGPDFPLVVVAGHTHVRAVVVLDACAVAVEAGRFSDTVGVVRMRGCAFERHLIDASRAQLGAFLAATPMAAPAAATPMAAPAAATQQEPDTPKGLAVRARIAAARAELGLDRVVGHASQTLRLAEPPGRPASLWGWFLRSVAPPFILSARFVRCGPGLLVTNAGTLRYDLLAGPVFVDDLFAVAPFSDELRVLRCVPSANVDAALHALAGQSSARKTLGGASAFLWTAFDADAQGAVDVVVDAYDAGRVFALMRQSGAGEAFRPGLSFHTALEAYFAAVPRASALRTSAIV